MGRLVRLDWRVGTVRTRFPEATRATSIALDVPGWPGHRPGQHVDVRLTALDGYTAQRSYSIASPPEWPRLWLTVERVDGGEVSPYLADTLAHGDELELRGPIGGHFAWSADDGGPLALIAGGSGVVPLMAMLRHHAARGVPEAAHCLVSARSCRDVLFREELLLLQRRSTVQVTATLTRVQPADWSGFARRIDRAMLHDVLPPPTARPRIFVCGPTGFVGAVADALVDLGHPPATIRTERFGPTGP